MYVNNSQLYDTIVISRVRRHIPILSNFSKNNTIFQKLIILSNSNKVKTVNLGYTLYHCQNND